MLYFNGADSKLEEVYRTPLHRCTTAANCCRFTQRSLHHQFNFYAFIMGGGVSMPSVPLSPAQKAQLEVISANFA